MSAKSYNLAIWRLRADAWCRLETPPANWRVWSVPGRPADEHHNDCAELLSNLSLVELYWKRTRAVSKFARLNRMFAAGGIFDKFAQSRRRHQPRPDPRGYRFGRGRRPPPPATTTICPPSCTGPATSHLRTTKRQPCTSKSSSIETLTEAGNAPGAQGAHARGVARRDESSSTRESLVVPNAVEALIAARLNMNLHGPLWSGAGSPLQTARDLPGLADFVDTAIADQLGGARPPTCDRASWPRLCEKSVRASTCI